ncbi:1,4-dihydroxy-2-naphthoate octaprenyltransferase [Halorubrum coriense DSM 10284]|uniref:1,4-dihydroxy-2-naphthoate octaprenyltransferase n=1 Tax=Halorubrum coriense DSM 10284 TaxID=1227466 RepID=M0ERC7_9EURY|nr:prenyltransferase [Halorubrum coriense]ELZ49638.1 1,4-dihydroxy-2-naphthoate octaprenyltransferase [Halorubrum coriense DSM 10284]
MDRRVLVALWRLSRPSQLALIALVYAFGVAMAYGRGHGGATGALRVGFGLAALLPVAASVHYANEYADVETDALTDRTPFSGGSGALVDTGLPRGLALRAGVVAGGLGLALVAFGVAGDPVLSPTAAALLAGILVLGWQYSVGPLRLAWNGLGAPTNALLGGVALPLYGFAVVAGAVTFPAALATLPFGVVVFVNLLETTWPDRRADAAVGKRTLATRWSPRNLRAAYGVGGAVAAVAAVALAGRVLPPVVTGATLLPLIGLVPGYRRFTRRDEPLPAVATMVALAAATTVAWALVAGGIAPGA